MITYRSDERVTVVPLMNCAVCRAPIVKLERVYRDCAEPKVYGVTRKDEHKLYQLINHHCRDCGIVYHIGGF
jgi:hypothetical protein